MTETATEELPLIEAPGPLTAHDRCDRCIAQAQARVTLVNGSELIFCQHHYQRYAPAMAELVASVYISPELTTKQ